MEMFDSRDETYKTPFGAVKQDVPIHFKIILPRDLCCRYATLKVYHDDSPTIDDNSMFWCGMYDELHEMWECHYTPCKIGLYWYNFEIRTDLSVRTLGKSTKNSKAVLDSEDKWQITCYKKDFSTPHWLRGGIMYQIFPDRFFKSGTPKKDVPTDRVIHKNWNDNPVYEPNEEGMYLNNDFFGGDLLGIVQKIPYLKSLGVTCVYLNPIFESHSNHRYDTADYEKIDVLLGDTEDFKTLCNELKKNGIRLILDGVFSHTGDDSIYFNKKRRYSMDGAYNSKESPFFEWYKFENWPNTYKSWWGIETLPETNENNKCFNEFINGKNGVVRKWIREGADGWRLDVADELTDKFLCKLRSAVKEERTDALIIGEVWEDASNKISYGHRRKFLLGEQLDSVMNYPFKDAILDFLTGTIESSEFVEKILCILENYPPPVIDVMMNSISTHDTVRAITRLGGDDFSNQSRTWQASSKLSPEQYKSAIPLLKIASAIQFTLPGIPCIYYGDEVGVQGYRDPFNRRPFPWDSQDTDLLEWYRYLAKIRKMNSSALSGNFCPLVTQKDFLSYMWKNGSDILLCFFNRGEYDFSINLNHLNIPLEIVIHKKSCKFISEVDFGV